MKRRTVGSAAVTALFAWASISGVARAAADPCNPATYSPAAYRFLEDCSQLGAEPADAESRQGLQRIRYLPLGEEPGRYVSLGGELRARWERLDPQRFGLTGGRSFTANEQRSMLDADVHLDRLRFFTQLNASAEAGWPVARPADHSALDLSQAFADWTLSDAGQTIPSFIRLGRQEIALAPNRLIGVNEATNIRRAFDGALAQFGLAGTTTTAFVTHPVLNRPGAFDDKPNDAERFSGIDVLVPLPAQSDECARLQSVTGFVYRRTRDIAVFQNASGPELRDTYGLRFAGTLLAMTYLLQLDYQRGHVGAERISAKAGTLDLGWRIPVQSLSPSIGASFGWAGGDKNAKDNTLQTFDTLYPNLSYGTEAGYFFPGNSRDVSFFLTIEPLDKTSAQVGVFEYWRVSSADAIYQPPGFVLIQGTGSGASKVATLPFFKVAHDFDRYNAVSLTAVRLVAQQVVTAQGGRSSNYGLVQWQFKF